MKAIVFLCSLLAGLVGMRAWAATDGEALFQQRCSICHKLPSLDTTPAEGWDALLQRMIPRASLAGDKKQAVQAYILQHQQQSVQTSSLADDRALFESRCSICHDLNRVYLEPLDDESRRHVVERMQDKAGEAVLSDDEVARILNYLSQSDFDKPDLAEPPADADAEQIFAARCSACHTLERVYAMGLANPEDSKADWGHIVARMREKSPTWISDQEAQEIAQFLQQARGESVQ